MGVVKKSISFRIWLPTALWVIIQEKMISLMPRIYMRSLQSHRTGFYSQHFVTRYYRILLYHYLEYLEIKNAVFSLDLQIEQGDLLMTQNKFLVV